MPGAAGEAMTTLLRAGFRVDGFPVLLCWDRPFADFSPLRADLARPAVAATRRRGRTDRCGQAYFRGVVPVPGPLVASGRDVAPDACPQDDARRGQRRRLVAVTPVLEPIVTVSPSRPPPTRSIRSRILGRGRDQAATERAVLVLHDVTKQLPERQDRPRATSTS